MNPYFKILQSSTSFDDRPPISYKVREYLESFIVENLLKKQKIIIRSKWKIHLSLTFCRESDRYKSAYILMAKTPMTIKDEGVKVYETLIPIKLIQEADNKYLKTIELMYEAITILFTTIYKRIDKNLMSELWESIDTDYLLTLPYPAPLIEQKYITDTITSNGEVRNVIEWSEIQSR